MVRSREVPSVGLFSGLPQGAGLKGPLIRNADFGRRPHPHLTEPSSYGLFTGRTRDE